MSVALSAAPEASPTIEQRVRSLYDEGKWTEAARLAASAPSRSPSVLFYQGLALARLRQFGQARSVLRQGRKLYPGDKRFPIELAGVAYRENDNRSAKKNLHAALKLDASDRYTNDFLATLYLLDGNVEAALKYWNRIDKPLIESVRFRPRPRLDPVLRERMFEISGGQVFTSNRLLLTEANADRLGIFSNVSFDVLPRADERFDVAVRTTSLSQPFSGWMGRVLPMLRQLPYEALAIDVDNVRGRGIDFESFGRWDSNKRRLNFVVSGPLHLNPHIVYSYSLDLRDEVWDLRQTYRGLR
ncbi:MAG: hypothetical protein JOZ62_15865, partial [Acidobacteriaceae bacterium]|nr:hypothetical protein [Acidobacteriaceae bacterium]